MGGIPDRSSRLVSEPPRVAIVMTANPSRGTAGEAVVEHCRRGCCPVSVSTLSALIAAVLRRTGKPGLRRRHNDVLVLARCQPTCREPQ